MPKDIENLVDEMMAPDEAMDAYPDECQNCGANADSFFVPNNYHELDNPSPGICTECGQSFG